MDTPLYEKINQRRKVECAKQWNDILKQIEEGPQYEKPSYSSWDISKIHWRCFSENDLQKKLQSLTDKKVFVSNDTVILHHNLSPNSL
jgi:hypothetical protein